LPLQAYYPGESFRAIFMLLCAGEHGMGVSGRRGVLVG
jgi:hypothetical protein